MFSSFSSFSCWVSSSFSSWVATSTTSLSSNTPPSRRNRRLIEVMRICDRKTDPAVEGSDRVTHCGVCHIRATNPSFSHCYLHIFFRGWNTLLHIHKSCLLPKKTDGLLGDPPALRYSIHENEIFHQSIFWCLQISAKQEWFKVWSPKSIRLSSWHLRFSSNKPFHTNM